MEASYFTTLNSFQVVFLWTCLFSFTYLISAADDNYVHQTNKRNRLLERHPRNVRVRTAREDGYYNNAVHFTGSGELMRFQGTNDDNDDVTTFKIPNKEFSVQLWIKPEGGQYRYTPIIGE